MKVDQMEKMIRALLSPALIVAMLGATAGQTLSTVAVAQEKPGPLVGSFPSRALRVLSSTAAGGANDVTARAVGEKLSPRIGQAVVVDNRPGGNGVIAMEALRQSAPDGYTLLSSGNLVVLNGVGNRVNYDVRKAFDVAVQMTSQPYFLVVPPATPIKTVKELIAQAKASPGTFNYGSSGIGSVAHLGFELFQSATGTTLEHVPYKSNALALPDFMSGRLQLLFVAGAGSAPLIRSGKMRALGVASAKRMAAFPDVPVIAESGVPGFEMSNAFYLYLPAGVPQNLQDALNRAVNQVVNLPEMKERFAADATEPGSGASPAALKKAFIAEYDMWDALIKKKGISLAD